MSNISCDIHIDDEQNIYLAGKQVSYWGLMILSLEQVVSSPDKVNYMQRWVPHIRKKSLRDFTTSIQRKS